MIYLYVKQHSVTGLKYFGKTKYNPFNYNGSGKYWKFHINKHGKNFIQTLDVFGFDNQELCSEFALQFSRNNNIIESKEWANLKEENGKDGGRDFGFKQSKETKNKIGISMIGKNLGKIPKRSKGYTQSQIHILNRAKSNRGQKRSEAAKENMRVARLKYLATR